MTVKELKAHIKGLPDHMEVFVADRKTDFAYGLVNSAYTKEIKFSEDEYHVPDNAPSDTVLILDES